MSNSFQKLFNMFSLIIIEILFSPFIYLCDAFTSLAISFVKRKPKTKKKPPPQSPFVKGTECGVPAIPFVKGCKLLCRGLLSCPLCISEKRWACQWTPLWRRLFCQKPLWSAKALWKSSGVHTDITDFLL